MPNARLTVKAMETWMKTESNKSIVDAWDLTTPSDLYNKDIVLYTIMKRGGSLEVLEYDPDLFYTDCAMFWAKWRRTVEKWVNALSITYNPLENYDRMEDWSDIKSSDGTTSSTRSSTEVVDDDSTMKKTGTETEVVDSKSTSDVTTDEKVSAFDSSSYEPSKQTIVDGEGTEDTTNTTTYNTTDTGTDDRTTTFSETLSGSNGGSENGTHSGRMHGNIGVTTSQQMLQAELELQYWNLYDHIADLFIGEMTTRVY